MIAEYADKLDKAQRNQPDWQDATQSIKQASQSGQLPSQFGQVADVCHRTFQSLPDTDQQYLGEINPDTRSALFMLAATLVGSDTKNDTYHQQKVTAVQHFVEKLSKESISGGSSR